MKSKSTRAIIIVAVLITLISISYAFIFIPLKPAITKSKQHISCTPERHVCVMKTLFGLEDNSELAKSITDEQLPAEVKASIDSSLSWIADAQLPNGGWGAGSHLRQDIRD